VLTRDGYCTRGTKLRIPIAKLIKKKHLLENITPDNQEKLSIQEEIG